MKINLFITNSCNLNCTYCYVAEKSNDFMTFEVAKSAIDTGIKRIKNPAKESLNISFSGGEPLLHAELIQEVVEYCRKISSPANYQITTNGLLMNEKIIGFLETNKFKLRVSLDGLNEKSNQQRFADQDISGVLSLFKDYRWLKTIRMTVSPLNIQHFGQAYLDILRNVTTSIDVGIDVNSFWSEDELNVMQEQLVLVKEYYETMFGEYKWTPIPLIDNAILYKSVGQTKSFCQPGDSTMAVDCNGNVYGCLCLIGDEAWKLGNVFEGNISSYRLPFQPAFCNDCPHFQACYNNCFSMNFMGTGDINLVPKAQCTWYKTIGNLANEIYEKYQDNGFLDLLHKVYAKR